MTKPLDQIGVAWRLRAFDGPVGRLMFVKDGDRWPTIADIVDRVPNLPARFDRDGEVRINGVKWPKETWHMARPAPREGYEVGITLHLPLRDGGGGGQGGGKSTIALLATVAVLLVAAAVSGGALALIPGLEAGLGFSLAGGSIGASVLGAAVGIAGALAIASLTKPPRIEAAAEPGAPIFDQDGKPASLSGNILAPGAPIPRVIGTRRVFPPLACQPFSYLIGDIEYAEAVFVLSGPHDLSEVRFGNVAAADIPEVVIELQEGRPESLTQSLVRRYARTTAASVELSRHDTDPVTQYQLNSQSNPDSSSPQWHPLISRDSPDEIRLRLVWPEGLFKEDLPTNAFNQSLRFRFRERGESTWNYAPEIVFQRTKPVPFQKEVHFVWGDAPTAPNVPPTANGPIYAFKHVPGQSAILPATSDFDAHGRFVANPTGDLLSAATLVAGTTNVRNVELFDERVVFYLDEATFPKGIYEIQVMGSAPYFGVSFTPIGYLYALGASKEDPQGTAPIVVDFFKYHISSGIYSTIISQAQTHNKVVIPWIASVKNDNPIEGTDFATLSARVRGRSLEQVSVLASGLVPDWDGVAWTGLTATSNPAPHFRDVLVGRMSSDPMPDDMVEDGELVDWRDHCDDMGYTINAVADGRSAKDVLGLIATCGYARERMSETWGVAQDKDRTAESPTQIFSPRNMRGFGFARGFPQKPSGFRVRYDNIDDDYREDEIIIDDPDAAPDQPTRYEQMRYDGLVDESDARARALFDLKQADLRFVFYRGEVPIEGLVCRKGDLVGIQHDVLTQQAGFARVLEVLKSGPNVTGIRVDGSIPVSTQDAWSDPDLAWSSYLSAWSAARTAVAIRLNDQTSIIKEVTAGDAQEETKQLSFVTPFVDPGASVLAADCLVVSGLYGSEYSRMLVLDMQPIADMNAAMTFVPEAPTLWS